VAVVVATLVVVVVQAVLEQVQAHLAAALPQNQNLH